MMRIWRKRTANYWVPTRVGMVIGPFRSEDRAWDYIAGRGASWLDPAHRYISRDAEPIREALS